MRVLIVEDEVHAARKLERQLKRIDPSVEILESLQSVDDAVVWLSNNTADLLFLDIHLGDALSFEIFERIDVEIPIIFTTAYDQYAVKAFKLNSVDYLLKPIKGEELSEALDKFKRQQLSQQKVDFSQLAKLLGSKAEASKEFQKRFMVYKGDKILTISVGEVSYFFAEGKYCYLVSKDGQEHLIDYTLDKLEKVLDPEMYFRTNRQFIVSLDSIGNMFSYSKGRVKIVLNSHKNEEVIVSVERSPEFKKWLNR